MFYHVIPLILRGFNSVINASKKRIKSLKKKLKFIYRIAIVSGLTHHYETLQGYNEALETCIIELEESLYESKKEVFQLKEQVDTSDKLINDYRWEIFALNEKLKNSASLETPLIELRNSWIDFHINRIDKNSFGAGQFYELYELRKQNAIDVLIEVNKADLSEAEINKIKQKTDYTENFVPYSEIDEETGRVLSVYDIARQLNGEC